MAVPRSIQAMGLLLVATACAHEMPQKAPPRNAQASSPAPLPFPDTAFRAEGEDDAGTRNQAASTRFETRRLGDRSDDGRPRYHGARMDLDVKGADLHDVFRLIADVGKVNIVVAGEVTGTITIKLKSVPWDQALDVVAKTKSLTLERDGNVLIVHAH